MVKRRIAIAVFVPLLIGAFIGYFGYITGRHYEPLAHRGAKTVGTVTAKEPMNHQSIRYEFSVGTARHSGADAAGNAFNRISVGDEVPVTYLPDRPSISTIGDAGTLYRSWIQFLLIVPTSIAFIPMVLAISVELFRGHLTNR